ncbi:CMRF35-like molecule 3 [Acipenser oxyrinchus oxyrinchus]|uniref:CMRF35-like molecule 3 n=1 Tax=Acipenser oxyrinchus oxyrinchus TaxID=40147 RepID=A0AAD8LQ24_ACIOX|nr:CMRF35-like molecule 3 [Acipenser oxyrinchus oxyrinchus]
MERLLLLLAVLPVTGAPRLSVTSHFMTGIEGGSVSVQCHYDRYLDTNVKYWCRGEVWSSCKIIQRSDEKQRDEDKVSISDDRTLGVFTVTVRRLEKKDAGWYWCGIERAGTDEGIQLNLIVDEAARSTTITQQPTTEQTSTSDPPSTEARQPDSTSPPAGTSENSHSQGRIPKNGEESSAWEFWTVWAALRWLLCAAVLSSAALVPWRFHRIHNAQNASPEEIIRLEETCTASSSM